jgi:hypothetical protein
MQIRRTTAVNKTSSIRPLGTPLESTVQIPSAGRISRT